MHGRIIYIKNIYNNNNNIIIINENNYLKCASPVYKLQGKQL